MLTKIGDFRNEHIIIWSTVPDVFEGIYRIRIPAIHEMILAMSIP